MQVSAAYSAGNWISSWSTTSSTSSTTTSSSTSSVFGPDTLAQFDLEGVLAAQTAYDQPIVPTRVRQETAAGLQYVSALLDVGRYDDARALTESLLEKNPTSAEATHALGVIALRQRDYSTAEQYFRKASFLDSEGGYDVDADVARDLQKSDDEVYALAQRLVKADDTQSRGMSLLSGLVQRNPLQTDARILLGEYQIKTGDATNGLSQYRLAILTADQSQLAHLEDNLDDLVKQAPDSAYVRRLLGETQLALGRNEEAAETFALATELSDQDVVYRAYESPAHVAIGYDKLDDNDIPGAIASFEHARQLDYGNSKARIGLGEAYVARGALRTRLGSLSAAVADFNTAAGKLRNGADEETRAKLASAAFLAGLRIETNHRASGDSVGDESVAFSLAYEFDSDNDTYRAKWAEINHRSGTEFLADGEYADAAAAFKIAYDLYQGNATYRDAAVNAFTLSGAESLGNHDYDDAVSAYRSAYDIGRGDDARLKLASALNARGLSYLADGELRKAREDFLAASRYDPNSSEYQDNYNTAAA